MDHSSQIEEHWKYATAFFTYKKKLFCYFSVSKKTNKLYIGFVDGNKIEHEKLVGEGRKQIRVFYIDPNKDVDIKNLKAILKIAVKLY